MLKKELEDLTRELKQYDRDPQLQLKYYECKYYELTKNRTSASYQDYSRLLADFKEAFPSDTNHKVEELKFNITQQVLRLQKCFVKILLAQPLASAGDSHYY